MAVNYANAVKAGRSQVVIDTVAGKTLAPATGAGAAPSLVIGTAALSGVTGVLASIPLAIDWATRDAAGVITLANTPLSQNPVLAGAAARAEIRDGAGNVRISGLTVGTVGSGAEIQLETVTVILGRPVQIASGMIIPA